MQIGFLEIRKTNVNVYGDGVNFFLGKDMMTYSVTWVKGKKNDGLKSPRNARNFLPNKTSPLLRLCDRLLLPPRLHTSFLPSSPPPPHPRRNPKWTPAPARTTPSAPRRRSSATSAAAARAWSRLSPPVYATRRWLPFAPDFACLSGRFAGADALLVLLVCADVEKFYQLCDPGESARSPRL